ncbi:MAG: hypothetical protein L3I99_01840 [Sulfurimonas sp.]|nr:hypothetical protein [Sulfurimonas sp.]
MLADLIGTSKETLDNATGEVGKEFVPLKAGIYKGKIKSIQVYVNSFGSNAMRYTCVVTDEDKIEREITHIGDINSKLKGDEDNKGYANRFNQYMYASNTSEGNISRKEKVGKLNSFGKEYEFDAILGMNDKPVIVEVLLRNDTNKAEGQPFKYSNSIANVLAPDGTDASGEDKATDFAAKCEKTPVSDYAGYIKNNVKTSTASNEQKVAADQQDF